MKLSPAERTQLARLCLEVALCAQRKRVMEGRRRPVPVPPVEPMLAEMREIITRGERRAARQRRYAQRGSR
jgi:hypothetical protein